MKNVEKIHSVEITTTQIEGSDRTDISKIIIHKTGKGEMPLWLYVIDRDKWQDSINFPLYTVQVWENGKCFEKIRITLSPNIVQAFINDLKDYFNYGRVLTKKQNTWRSISTAFCIDMGYRDVKKILSFERRASRIPLNRPKPIRTADPIHIHNRLDCGDYIIESWGGLNVKKSYTCLTFNKDTTQWLKSQKVRTSF